jgi:hypothetical protein
MASTFSQIYTIIKKTTVVVTIADIVNMGIGQVSFIELQVLFSNSTVEITSLTLYIYQGSAFS